MRRNNPSDLTQTRLASAIVNRKVTRTCTVYQKLRFPGITKDEGLLVSQDFWTKEAHREREEKAELWVSGNEYNQNDLVEKQPRAIPYQCTRPRI